MMAKLWQFNADMELCVRIHPEHDKDFITRIKADSESQYRIGNIFISDIRSFKDLRRNFQQAQNNVIRNHITGMAFLMVNIFLGLLGTFWFRTQQRKSEIALHKAHGATNRMMYNRLLSEGWGILLLVTPLALLIDFNLAYAELNAWRNGTTFEVDRLLFCALISFLLFGLMITIGVSIPAHKAMKIHPAEALHNE
jgi:putative ABC transport system permease protein